MTLRERVNEYQNEILVGEVLPDRAIEILKELSALYGNILDRIKDTQLAYNTILLTHLEIEKTANRATIKAQTTTEYQNFLEALNTKELVKKMISSLNRYTDYKKEELKVLRFQ
jgi:hypothetical protein